MKSDEVYPLPTSRTMTYTRLITACESIPLGAADLIYVAIGCSQKWYQATDARKGSPQEYPPFVADWPGRKLCILIDPELENEPVGITEAGGTSATLDDCVPLTLAFDNGKPTVTFVALRQYFHWNNHAGCDPADCRAFLNALIQRALPRPAPYMIVQDYSGPDIRRYYPLERFGVGMMGKVLFDITGGDPGCFVDFSKYHILRDSAGHFIQPHYTPLWKLKGRGIVGKAFTDLVLQRYNLALDSAARCWRAQNGHDIPRDWYAPSIVAGRIRSLLFTYGTSHRFAVAPNGDPLIPFEVAEELIFDLCATVGHYMSHTEVYALMTGPFDDLRASVKLLRDLAISENS